MEDKVKAIIEAYQSGMSQEKVAKLYGVNQTTVSRFLRKNKIPTHRTKKKEPVNLHTKRASLVEESVKQSIIEAYEGGATTREIGALCGLNHGTVAGYLRAWKVHTRPHSVYILDISEQDRLDLIKLYKNGSSLYDLSKRINRAPKTVGAYLKKWGVKLRRHNSNIMKIHDKDISAMVQMYHDGSTTLEIAKKFKVNKTTVARRLRSVMKLRPSNRPRELTQEEINGIIADYKAGKNVSRLSREYNIPAITARRIVGEGTDVLDKIASLEKELLRIKQTLA